MRFDQVQDLDSPMSDSTAEQVIQNVSNNQTSTQPIPSSSDSSSNHLNQQNNIMRNQQPSSIPNNNNTTTTTTTTTTATTTTTNNRSIPSSSSSPSSSSKLPQPINMCSFGPRLGFTYFRNPIPDPNLLNHLYSDSYWFTIDSLLIYLSFFQDTGPLNCACLYRFCLHLHGLLEDDRLSEQRIVMYSSEDPDKKANSALLMCLYCMIVLRWSPADALHPISHLEFQPFRDAGYARADFNLSIQNVLFGIKKAIDLRLLRLDEFDLREYETFEKVENGDYNWLSPHFIAFASPVELSGGNGNGGGHGNSSGTSNNGGSRINKSFKMILDQFEKVGVRLVIRLNKKLYDENRFLERGIAHKEMYFDDGTNPTMEMVKEFITVSERIIEDGGVVAVHCKAGLGRTGTLIGAYLIYKYNFTAEEAIGFMRIMRPGTCVGPQQHFLYENQMTWAKWAARDELLTEQEAHISPSKTERPITPPPDSNQVPISSTITTPPPNPNNLTSPGRDTAVPGQPRKTPGAKTRHMVAVPESRPTTGKALIEEEEEEMIEEGNQPTTVTVIKKPNSRRTNPIVKTVTATAVATATGTGGTNTGSPIKTGVQQGSKPVPRPRPRPASAMSDHRPTGGGMTRRGRGVKDLGTLFEGLSKNGTKNPPPPNNKNLGVGVGGNRYNLRGGGSRVTSNGGMVGGGVGCLTDKEEKKNNEDGDGNFSNSPSRLPQRVINRRRGMVNNNSDNNNYEGNNNISNRKEHNLRNLNHNSTIGDYDRPLRNGSNNSSSNSSNNNFNNNGGGNRLRDYSSSKNGKNGGNGNERGKINENLIRKGLGVEERSVRRRRSSLSHTDVLM